MSEQLAIEELKAVGVRTEIYPTGKDRYGVFLGGHGGAAPTLRKAMRKCLRFRNMYRSWKMPDGRPAVDVFGEIAERHLGGWKKMEGV